MRGWSEYRVVSTERIHTHRHVCAYLRTHTGSRIFHVLLHWVHDARNPLMLLPLIIEASSSEDDNDDEQEDGNEKEEAKESLRNTHTGL